MSNLVEHARRELTIIREDPDTADSLVRIVEEFARMGHSGMSAAICAEVHGRLLRFEPLSPLTDDPDEWTWVSEDIAGQPDLWQSRRSPEAFSNDAGAHYWLVSERTGDLEVTPIYPTTSKDLHL